jgi:hypothetical protein
MSSFLFKNHVYENPHDDPFYHEALDFDFDNLVNKLKVSFHYLKSISVSSTDLIHTNQIDKCIYKFTRLIFIKEKQPFGLPQYEELEYIDFYFNTDNIYMEKYKTHLKYFYKDTETLYKMFYINQQNQIHTDIPNKAALFTYYRNLKIEYIYYFKNNLIHSEESPAIIHFDEHSEIIGCYCFQNGLLHDLDGHPAVTLTKNYYEENEEDSYHSEDLNKIHFYKGVKHRSDGPAFIDIRNEDNNKYYLHGIQVNSETFDLIDDKFKSYNEYNVPGYIKLNHLYE